jgi:hypothetical protein
LGIKEEGNGFVPFLTAISDANVRETAYTSQIMVYQKTEAE